MLVLSRLEGQRIRLKTSDGELWIRLILCNGNSAMLGIAPLKDGWYQRASISLNGGALRLMTTDGGIGIQLVEARGLRAGLGITAPDAVIIESEEVIDRQLFKKKEKDHVSSKPV